MSDGPHGYASQASILVEAILDEAGKPPCDPPDDCPVCVLVTEQRQGESRHEWLARLRDGAFGQRKPAPIPERPSIQIAPVREVTPVSISESNVRAALADLKVQERELTRQLMKVRGGIEAIGHLLSGQQDEVVTPSAADPTVSQAPVEVSAPPESDTSSMSFGDLLRTYRKHAGLSQASLAEATGLTPGAICYLESGRSNPRRSTALTLVTALNLSVDRARALLTAEQRREVIS